ncbi:hypothetical protein SSRP02_p017 [Synechococcus phage S-SRP02]|nr:hypothetical protein SSRP02_p017 [Synechococcus phage S-SRP02]
MDNLNTNLRDRIAAAKRSPRRISVTVSDHVATTLEAQSTRQGRSISNLCAYLLEAAITGQR